MRTKADRGLPGDSPGGISLLHPDGQLMTHAPAPIACLWRPAGGHDA